MPVTTPERTILDALKSGTQPDQVEIAIVQAVGLGLTTPSRLRSAAASRSMCARALVERTLKRASGDETATTIALG